MKLNLFAISSLLVFIFNLLMAVFVFLKAKGKKMAIIWSYFCLVVTIWGFGGYKASTTLVKETAFFWWQISFICVILAPVIYSHVVFEFVKLNKKSLIISLYCMAGIFLYLNFFNRDLFLGELKFVFNQFYWPDWFERKSLVYLLFYLFFYWFILLYSFFLLLKHYKYTSTSNRNQTKYFLLGTIIGWIGAECMFFPVFRIYVYPLPNFLIAIYPFIISYAIVRHRLLDIDIVIKKGLVYSILLAIITAGYLLFVVAIGLLFQGLIGYRSILVNLFAIFVIALLFNPLRYRIQRFLDIRFFKGTLESLAKEKEQLQQELYNNEKLSYVGKLASSIVHEIKSPLTAIKTYVEYLPQKYNDPEFREKFEHLIPKEIERMNRVVLQLLDLSRPREPVFQSVNIANTIDTTLSLLENNLKLKRIEVKNNYSDSDILIQADEEQLRQVFLNLFLNSIQAMDEGGILTISTSIQHQGLSIGQSVTICVQDNGVGISEENLKKLFTPFFTTKQDGVGLGLIVTQEIIKMHKGEIRAESKLGEGTKFIIELLRGK